jgi:hypothetical protein
MDRLDGRKVAIGNANRFVGCGEPDAVAYGKLAVILSVNADAAGIGRS